MISSKNFHFTLIYMGAIPFVIGSILLVLGFEEILYLGRLEWIIGSYGLVICSFIAGVHWGQFIQGVDLVKINLPLTSNSIVLLAWFLFLILNSVYFFYILILLFFVLLAIDYQLFKLDRISLNYIKCRAIVTTAVNTALLISGITIN
ncbi:MAG: DUF3429 domain-containing protein [Rhodospirillaceae bacterium]|nr:DUF3429 domain-containing protein [Rhodospirillaceae bacterium]OUT80313.1 MAG: hypothetical protein CBB83_01940 [Rhodospirillaceae bacterium TMED23]|tara:strand:- start:3132 stop:3575 length:444 start_codon:yes stop_codon:yes gene_type:complete